MSVKGLVGFIGLGNMGAPMARNLMNKGHKLVIFDALKANKESLAKEGAMSADSPAQVASECGPKATIVTMLPAGQHVRDVYTASDGILSSVKEGALLLDASTIDRDTCVQVAAEARAKGATYMDTPVSGGVGAAQKAALTFMVGGERFEDAKLVLQHMGAKFFHCGEVGTGQAAKLCNNMMLAISMIGASETMNLGLSLGLDKHLLTEVLCASSGRCWSLDTYNPVPGVMQGVPSANNYQGGFGVQLMTKDLGLASSAASSSKTAIPMGSLAHQMYRILCSHGYAQKDFSSVYQFLKEYSDEK